MTVAAEDEVRYRHLVRAMDVAIASRFSELHISDAAARIRSAGLPRGILEV